jgi:hypothetical protein
LVLNQNPQPGKLGDLSFKPGFKLDKKGLNILNEVPNIIISSFFQQQVIRQNELASGLLSNLMMTI